MPRRARVIVPGLPHHITHRGNRRSDIFRRVEDRLIYLRLLRKHAEQEGLQIWAYALMTNHIHLVAVPECEESLEATIRAVHGTYAILFNGQYDTVGHLWQGRFYSCVLDDSHSWNAVRYVERNPVRAGLVRRAEDYRWSSAFAHCGLGKEPMLSIDFPPKDRIMDWSAWLAVSNLQSTDRRIRHCTFRGYPCGTLEFIGALEKRLGRTLRRRNRGRPRLVTDGTPDLLEKIGT